MSAEYKPGKAGRIVRRMGLGLAIPAAGGLIAACSSGGPNPSAERSAHSSYSASAKPSRSPEATMPSRSPQPTEGPGSLPAFVHATVSATCGPNPTSAEQTGAPFELTPATGIRVRTKKYSFSIATTNADRPNMPVDVTTSRGKKEVGGQGKSVVIVFYGGGSGTLTAAADGTKPVWAERNDWTLWTACGTGSKKSAEAAARSRATDLRSRGLGPTVINEIGPNGKITPVSP